MERTDLDLRFLLDFGRFSGSETLARMEAEAMERWGGTELDDTDLTLVTAAGELPVPPPPPQKEDGHGT